jgi:hypothetical protein
MASNRQFPLGEAVDFVVDTTVEAPHGVTNEVGLANPLLRSGSDGRSSSRACVESIDEAEAGDATLRR